MSLSNPDENTKNSSKPELHGILVKPKNPSHVEDFQGMPSSAVENATDTKNNGAEENRKIC